MRLVCLLLIMLSPTAAHAQQPPQIMTAVQRCANIVGMMESENATLGERSDQTLVQLNAVTAELTKAQARIKELEAKPAVQPTPEKTQ
jgi:hypothetical protein